MGDVTRNRPNEVIFRPIFFYWETAHRDTLVVKFADDTTVTGFISQMTSPVTQIESIVGWCDENIPKCIESKTNGDFKRIKSPIAPLSINDTVVEQVSSFKFLGTRIPKHLSRSVTRLNFRKKSNHCFYFLPKNAWG